MVLCSLRRHSCLVICLVVFHVKVQMNSMFRKNNFKMLLCRNFRLNRHVKKYFNDDLKCLICK